MQSSNFVFYYFPTDSEETTIHMSLQKAAQKAGGIPTQINYKISQTPHSNQLTYGLLLLI